MTLCSRWITAPNHRNHWLRATTNGICIVVEVLGGDPWVFWEGSMLLGE